MAAGTLLAGSSLAAGDPPREKSHEIIVRVEGGRVSAAFLNAPLVEAVTELAREAGFELVVEGEIDRRVSLTRRDMEITGLLGELLQSCSWFSQFGEDAEGGARLSQVWILQSPGCGDAGAGTESRTVKREPSTRARPVPASFSTIDKDDLAQRQRYLSRVINGRARASVDELVKAVRDPRNQSIKMLAIMALGRAGGADAQAALVEALSDEDMVVRLAAVRSLGQGWREAAVSPINSLLATEREAQVIQIAVQQLGMIGTESAWDALRRAKDSEDPKVSAIAEKIIRFFHAEKENLPEIQ